MNLPSIPDIVCCADDAKLNFGPDLQESITDEIIRSDDHAQLMHAALQKCLAKLPPQDRQRLLQHYAKSTTRGEYTEQVGRSVGGSMVSLHRLRNRLLECLDRRLATSKVTL